MTNAIVQFLLEEDKTQSMPKVNTIELGYNEHKLEDDYLQRIQILGDESCASLEAPALASLSR